MDLNQVTLKIPVTDIVPIKLEHAKHSNNGDRKYLYSYKGAEDYIRHEYVYSDFEVLLDSIPAKTEILSMTFPIQQSITTIDGHNTFIIFVEEASYAWPLNDDEKQNMRVPDAAINHINNYKYTYKKFPTIKFQICTHFYIDSGNSEEMDFYMYPPVLECKIKGNQGKFKPSADVIVGHKIPDGFSAIYELLNEEVADDDFTEISSKGEDPKSSTVLVNLSVEKAKISQIRLNSRIYIDLNHVGSSITFLIYVGEKYYEIKQYENGAFLTNDNAWYTDKYYSFESVISKNASIIKEINSYYRANGTMPLIYIEIITDGQYYEGSSGSKTTIPKVSQVYLDVVYEDITNIGIFDKVGGAYKAATAAYRKTGGAWSEITEDEAKTILKNNTIRRG